MGRDRGARRQLTGGWRLFLTALVVMGALSGVFSAPARVGVEKHARSVELVLDYKGAAELSRESGVPLERVLLALKEAGVTSLAVPEYTLADAVGSGDVSLLGASELLTYSRLAGYLVQTGLAGGLMRGLDPYALDPAFGPANSYVLVDEGSRARALLDLLAEMGIAAPLTGGAPGTLKVYRISLDQARAAQLSLGLSPDA